MFQLLEEEVDLLVSQNAIPSRKHPGGSLQYAFTEQGVAGIFGVLTSDRVLKQGQTRLTVRLYYEEKGFVKAFTKTWSLHFAGRQSAHYFSTWTLEDPSTTT